MTISKSCYYRIYYMLWFIKIQTPLVWLYRGTKSYCCLNRIERTFAGDNENQ